MQRSRLTDKMAGLETDNNRRLHIAIQCMLDEEIPETSEPFRKLKQLCMRLLQVDLENCNKASDIFDTLEEKRRIGIGQYGELKQLLNRCGLEEVVNKIEDIEISIPTSATEADALPERQRPYLQPFNAVFDIITASTVIGKWRELARKLEITERDILIIDRKNDDVYEHCHQMLLKWKQISGARGTSEQLMKALIDIGHQEEADKIEEYLRINSL